MRPLAHIVASLNRAKGDAASIEASAYTLLQSCANCAVDCLPGNRQAAHAVPAHAHQRTEQRPFVSWIQRSAHDGVNRQHASAVSGQRCAITYKALGPAPSRKSTPDEAGSDATELEARSATGSDATTSQEGPPEHEKGPPEPENEDEAALKQDWVSRILKYAVILGVALSFYLHAPSFYGPLSGQLTLLRADLPLMRRTGLQRLALSVTEDRLEEFRESKGYSRVVEVLSIEEDESVRLEIYRVLKALAKLPTTRPAFAKAGLLEVLQGLAPSENGQAKEACLEVATLFPCVVAVSI